jgi:hypothetical protein
MAVHVVGGKQKEGPILDLAFAKTATGTVSTIVVLPVEKFPGLQIQIVLIMAVQTEKKC